MPFVGTINCITLKRRELMEVGMEIRTEMNMSTNRRLSESCGPNKV